MRFVFDLAKGVLLLVLLLPVVVPAQEKLVVMSHAVHQSVATGEQGGDVTADWRKQHGIEIEWLTFGVDPLHERLFREISLSEGSVDMAFMLARYGGPQIAGLFEDLGEYQQRDPIEQFEDISPSMRAAHTYHGKLIGIPFRHATHGLHYNEVYLKEQGLDGPPRTFEEFIEYAEKLTYTRDDGTKVYGFVTGGTRPTNIVDLIRVFGGDFITNDYQVVVDQEGAVKGISVLREFFEKGIIPKGFLNFTTEDPITYMQQGRAAMAIEPFGRQKPFNDPEQAKFPGQIKVTTLPMAQEFHEQNPLAPAKTSVWAMAIPKNSPHKELAWSLIKQLSAPDSTIREAINGNGPVRLSAYDDPQVQEKVPYAASEAAILQIARLPMPGSENSAKIMDAFIEEVQAAVLGLKTPQAAMSELKNRVEPMLTAN